jgi:hypothetical protein
VENDKKMADEQPSSFCTFGDYGKSMDTRISSGGGIPPE